MPVNDVLSIVDSLTDDIYQSTHYTGGSAWLAIGPGFIQEGCSMKHNNLVQTNHSI